MSSRLEGAPNFRDLGGVAAAGGRRVRHGRVYRSEVLVGVTDADLDTLRALEIAAVCDLRHGEERTKKVNRWPDDVPVVTVGGPPGEGMDAVQATGVQSRIAEPGFDPAIARELVLDGYRVMPRALAAPLAAVFDHLLQPDPAPLLIHCTSGKDRSGFVSALLLAALGVSRDAIRAEYLLSRERYPVDKIRQMLVRYFGDALPSGRLEELVDIASVSPKYLDAAFGQIRSEFGGVERYLADVAGLDEPRRQRLKDALLEGVTNVA